MPLPASQLERDPFLRLLLLGAPKAGKSTAAIATSPGPVRVLLCEDQSALRGAKRLTSNFDFEPIGGWNSMQSAMAEARKDAEAGKIRTVVIDPLSDFADRVLREAFKNNLTKEGNEDGRKAYPECTKRLKHLAEQIFMLPCHAVVICHYMELGGETGEGIEKTGKGIVPLLPGQARAVMAAKFVDVIWMDVRQVNGKSERVFVTGPEGAWGPGCRSLSGTHVLPADVGELIKLFEEDWKPAKKPALVKPNNSRPSPQPPVRR
jgi:hypothetical protein